MQLVLQQLLRLETITKVLLKKILVVFFSLFISVNIHASIDDYLFSDVGVTSNIHGEIGLINIPSSRILEEGNLKLHLVNSEPINSFVITSTPFNWMEVSLRYSDINFLPYSWYESFSGKQTWKDKSFNMKLRLIKETNNYPELSIGFRDLIGTGWFSSEYLVASKKIGDFDFTVGVGWGNLSTQDGLENPFISYFDNFRQRTGSNTGAGGNFGVENWFRGEKVSTFYGFEYTNKRSGLRFKLDYDSSNPWNLKKTSNYSYGLSIPASKLVDVNLFKHRGEDIGIGVSFKANYSEEIVQKNDLISTIEFSKKDSELLKNDNRVFSGTINVILNEFGIYTQEIHMDGEKLFLTLSQTSFRNPNIATKRTIGLIKNILEIKNISYVSIVYQDASVNTQQVSFPTDKFYAFLENRYSYPELKRHLNFDNFSGYGDYEKIFQGDVKFPIYSWGLNPNLKTHIGAPESFLFSQVGISLSGAIDFSKQTAIRSSVTANVFNNFEGFRLRAFSRLPKVRSDVREYLKQGEYAIDDFSISHIFKPNYSKRGLFISGIKLGILESMFGGVGGEVVYRDITKPWFISANFYWVKQREFRQRFAFRDYETFTGHVNFTWDTPVQGLRLNIAGGRYLARDSGFTLNFSKTFKSGFILGAFATKTDISDTEFGEGSFDKGIYFSIPIDLVSKQYRKGNARFLWRNLTRDGGQMVSGGLGLTNYIESNSSLILKRNGF